MCLLTAAACLFAAGETQQSEGGTTVPAAPVRIGGDQQSEGGSTIPAAPAQAAGSSASTARDGLPDLKAYFAAANQLDSPDWNFRTSPLLGEDPADTARFGNLTENSQLIDSYLEFALITYYSEPERPWAERGDAILPLNNPRLVDRQLGALVLKELAELKFLDPNNTAAIGRYEGMLTFITDRGNVARAEIETIYRQNIRALIAAAVDAEFNKVRFLLKDSPNGAYSALLTRNTQNQYILSYEGYFSDVKSTKSISAPSLEALLAEMQSGSNRTDFDQGCINQVNAENANIPAVFLGKIGKDPRADLAAIITEFYLNPTNQTVYGALRDVNVYYDVAGGTSNNPTNRAMYEMIGTAYMNTLAALSPGLKQRVINDSRGRTSTTLSSEVRSRLQF
jgi:hypothetical protein